MSPKELSELNLRLDGFRHAIRQSFPAAKFEGKVTNVDGEWTPELDDEQSLFEQLHGTKWTEIPTQFVYDHPGDVSLLTCEAFAAFLPAWLERSLDNPSGKNEVRAFFVYTFNPGHELTIPLIAGYLRCLSEDQQRIVRKLMAEFANHEPSRFTRARAVTALAFIDKVLAS